MKNPFTTTLAAILAMFGIFALYQVILSIAAVVGGAFVGSAITMSLMKKPRVETQGQKELIDLKEQIDLSR